jgi:hypothetical protein
LANDATSQEAQLSFTSVRDEHLAHPLKIMAVRPVEGI